MQAAKPNAMLVPMSTPMLMIWEGRIAPRTISRFAYSQLDIAPSLLDRLGIREVNHFIGRSFLQPHAESQHIVHLIQPYDNYYAAVLYPYKYVINSKSGEEFLFDLEEDGHEERNVLAVFEDTETMQRLRSGIDEIFHNQTLLESNRIWPASHAGDSR